MTAFTVNGQPVRYAMDPATPLLWALRDASNLTGTKYGCGTGDCGACTVHVDGAAVRSCGVTIGAIEGSFVVTIEGLSADRAHPVQQAMVAEGAVRCGYCTPGIVMAAAALLARDADPTEATVDAAIPHVCRCGAQLRLRAVVARAARVLAGEPIAAAPPPGIDPADAARAVPALTPR